MNSLVLTRRRRLAAGALTLAVALGAAGCGSGGGGSSDKDYYAAFNTFCKSVNTASNAVKPGAAQLQKQIVSDPQNAIKAFAPTLDKFASSIDSALGDLKKADVPSKYQDFNKKAIAAFDEFIARVRKGADGVRTGKATALSDLQTQMSSLKAPPLPKDVRANAKACDGVSS